MDPQDSFPLGKLSPQDEILIELNGIKFPRTKSRKNISSKWIEAFCLGDVNYRGQAAVDYKIRGPSKYNIRYPELFKKLQDFAIQENINYTTIQINKNIKSPPHIDKNNVGLSYIISLGDFTGGELIIEGKSFDIHKRLIKFDGNKGHWTVDFIGTRYSIIYFTHTFKPPCSSKRNIIITEEGAFKKGILVRRYV